MLRPGSAFGPVVFHKMHDAQAAINDRLDPDSKVVGGARKGIDIHAHRCYYLPMTDTITQNWIELAEYDLETAQHMLKTGRFLGVYLGVPGWVYLGGCTWGRVSIFDIWVR